MKTSEKPLGFAHAPEERLLRRLTRAINVIESWNLPPYPAADWEIFDFENIPTIYRQLLRQISLLKKISPGDLDSELFDTYIDIPNGSKTQLFIKEVDRLISRIKSIDRALKNLYPAVWEIYDENGRGLAMLRFVADQPLTRPVVTDPDNPPPVEPDTIPIPASITRKTYAIPDHIEHHLDKIRVVSLLLEDMMKPLMDFGTKIAQTEVSQMPGQKLSQGLHSNQPGGSKRPPAPVYTNFTYKLKNGFTENDLNGLLVHMLVKNREGETSKFKQYILHPIIDALIAEGCFESGNREKDQKLLLKFLGLPEVRIKNGYSENEPTARKKAIAYLQKEREKNGSDLVP